MENIKRRVEFFSLYDHTNIEKHLEKMASKGWMIEVIGSTFWRYKRIEPQKLKFSVVYYPKDVNEGTVISADRQNFIDMCTSGGWDYVVNSGRMHVFCTDNEHTPPIETDAEIQIECIHKFAKKDIITNYLSIIVACILFVVYFGYEAWKNPLEAISDDLKRTWYIPILFVFSIYNIISYVLWHKKAKLAAENGEFTNTKRLMKIEVLFWLPFYYVGCTLEFLKDMRLTEVIFTLGLIVLGIGFYKLIDIARSAINKKEYKTEKKRKRKNLVTFLLVVAFIASGIGAYILIPKPYNKVTVETDKGPKTYKVYNDEGAPLDINDFANTENKTVYRYKSTDKAIIINETEWSIYTIEQDDNFSIYYTITDVPFAPLYERCKEELIYNNEFHNYKKTDTGSSDYEIYIDEDKDYERSYYAFCNDKKFVNISFGWEPSEEELIFAAEKLLNS